MHGIMELQIRRLTHSKTDDPSSMNGITSSKLPQPTLPALHGICAEREDPEDQY